MLFQVIAIAFYAFIILFVGAGAIITILTLIVFKRQGYYQSCRFCGDWFCHIHYTLSDIHRWERNGEPNNPKCICHWLRK